VDGTQVEVLVTELPDDQWPPPGDQLDWCPRVAALDGRRPADRRRSLAADHMLRDLCRRWHVRGHWYRPGGQPACGPGAHLTASHDGTWVVAAAADRPLGVDVVDCRRASAWVTAIMSADELDQAHAEQPGTPGSRAWGRAWGRAWAVREAALKRAGVGMSIDPRALTVARGPDHSTLCLGGTWWTVGLPDGRTTPVAVGTVDHDHVLALAVEPPVTVRLRGHHLS